MNEKSKDKENDASGCLAVMAFLGFLFVLFSINGLTLRVEKIEKQLNASTRP